jgi:hypothetical protein
MREFHTMAASMSGKVPGTSFSPMRGGEPAGNEDPSPLHLIAGSVLIVIGLLVAYDWWTSTASHADSKFMFMMSAALILMGAHAVATHLGLNWFGGDGAGLGVDFDFGHSSSDGDSDGDGDG